MKWNDLSIKDKADFIRIGVRNGYRDRSKIISLFNMYAEGGEIPPGLPPASELFSAPSVPEDMPMTVNPTLEKTIDTPVSPVASKDYVKYPGKGTKEEYTKWFGDAFQPQLANTYRGFLDDYAQRASTHHPNVTSGDVYDIINTTPVEYSPLGDGTGGSYYTASGIIRMNDAMHNDTYLPHELSHALDYRLGLGTNTILEGSPDISTYKLSPQDTKYLTPAYLKIPKDNEKRAVNTQLRYRLYKNSGNKTGKELDKYIDSLSKEDLIKAVDSLETGYFTGKDINGFNFEKIKEALKNVASTNKVLSSNYAANGGFLLYRYT